jgi:hypothetical protein
VLFSILAFASRIPTRVIRFAPANRPVPALSASLSPDIPVLRFALRAASGRLSGQRPLARAQRFRFSPSPSVALRALGGSPLNLRPSPPSATCHLPPPKSLPLSAFQRFSVLAFPPSPRPANLVPAKWKTTEGTEKHGGQVVIYRLRVTGLEFPPLFQRFSFLAF